MTKSCYSGLCCAASCDSALSDGYMRCQSTPGLGGSEKCCVYLIQDDCRTTIWTYQENHDGALDQFQPDEELKRRKISFVRRRRDIYKALGPGSEAEDATLLAFGTLFSGPYKGSESYFDIHAPKIKAIELDTKGRKANGPVHMFIMTDLPQVNWTNTYLADVAEDGRYKLYTLKESDELVRQTAERLMAAEHGVQSGFLPKTMGSYDTKNDCSPVQDSLKCKVPRRS